MLTTCRNCATFYGVEGAGLLPLRAWLGQARCDSCHGAGLAPLSPVDKLMLAADIVAPPPRTIVAVAQAFATRSRPLKQIAAAPAHWRDFAGIEHDPFSADVVLDVSRWKSWRRSMTAAAQAVAARLASSSSTSASGWQTWRPSTLQLLIIGLIFVDAAIVSLRNDMVGVMPQTASFYAELGLPVNVRELRFDSLTAATERLDGKPVLIVNGQIGNATNKLKQVPALRLAIRNAEHEEIYSWIATPDRKSLAPGKTLAFHSELTLPPPETREVVARFLARD